MTRAVYYETVFDIYMLPKVGTTTKVSLILLYLELGYSLCGSLDLLPCSVASVTRLYFGSTRVQ